MNKKELTSTLAQLAKYLRKESRDICRLNECTDEEHNCESYAYFMIGKNRKNNAITSIDLMTVCMPDYASRSYDAAVSLPFDGYGEDLLAELLNER